MTAATISKAEAKMDGYIFLANYYGASFTLSDVPDGQMLVVHTTDHDDNLVEKLVVLVWTDAVTGRVRTRANWLSGFVRKADKRLPMNQIEGHIETAATERAAHWI